MGNEKQPESDLFVVAMAPVLRFLRSFPRGAVLFVFTAAILVALPFLAWQRWGRDVVRREQYKLDPAKILIPQQPEWIHADVRDEVLSVSSLQGASLLDPDLTVKLARSFAAHPWVARVRRISKSPPDHVVVELEYRMPIAIVEMTSPNSASSNDPEFVVFAIDPDAILLPSDYFIKNPAELARYPRISVEGVSLSVHTGMPWGDHRISAAAKVANELLPGWDRYGLYRIGLLVPLSAHQSTPPLFVLSTRKGARVIWGHAPRKETSGEPSFAEKIRRLETYVDRFGSLQDVPATTVIDLTDAAQQPPAAAATARRQSE